MAKKSSNLAQKPFQLLSNLTFPKCQNRGGKPEAVLCCKKGGKIIHSREEVPKGNWGPRSTVAVRNVEAGGSCRSSQHPLLPFQLWLVQHGADAGGQELPALAHQQVSAAAPVSSAAGVDFHPAHQDRVGRDASPGNREEALEFLFIVPRG